MARAFRVLDLDQTPVSEIGDLGVVQGTRGSLPKLDRRMIELLRSG
jgi:hypothetical protein